MQRLAFFAVVVLLAAGGAANGAGPYDAARDGWKDIEAAGARAAANGSRVLVIAGGNWCGWCRALDRLLTSDEKLKAELAANWQVVHLNYSKDNKNEVAFERLGHPETLGFPHLVVMAPDLRVLSAQGTEGFETGDPKRPGHDAARVLAFLRRWSVGEL